MFTEKYSKRSPTKTKAKAKSKRPLKYADGGLIPLPEDDPRKEYREARRDIRSTPPVTIAEDIIGRFSDSKAQNNATRDAIRRRAFKTIKDSGYEDK